MLGGKRTLGVHVRGTDYRYQVIGHPIIISPTEYLQEAKRLMMSGKYEQVFLATDDLDALELFKNGMPDGQIVYYSDVQRSSGFTAPFEVESSRPLHKYKLGLEVLRDAYTLANCDGLLAGRSMVSNAARYINLTLNKQYIDCVVLDKGVLRTNSKAAKKRLRRLKRMIKEAELNNIPNNEHTKNIKE